MCNTLYSYFEIRIAYSERLLMEIRTLRYFLVVAREQSLTRAANVLHVTQPTLSRQIAQLERELGCTLLERTNRSVALTEEGLHLRQRAEEIVVLADRTKDEFAEDDAALSGTIRIGAGETRAMHTVTDVLAQMRRDYPQVRCELSSGNADAVEERLAHGLLDFGVFIEPVKLDACDWVRLPEPDRVGVIVSTHTAWAQLSRVTPEILARMPLLISSRSSQRMYDLGKWSGGAVDYGKLDIVGSYDLFGNASLLVETGVACALGIDHLLQLEGRNLRFVPLAPAMQVSSVLAWRRLRIQTKASREFLRRLRVQVET